jgi:hypothetical protein
MTTAPNQTVRRNRGWTNFKNVDNSPADLVVSPLTDGLTIATIRKRMKNMKRWQIAMGLALCVACFCAEAQSPVVFTTGPINGNGGVSIEDGYAVADSFTLAAPVTIGSASFGEILAPDDSLKSVNWVISSTAFGPALASGTALDPTGVYVSSGGPSIIDSESISISDVSLEAGTYYFELNDAQTALGVNNYWCVNGSDNSIAEQQRSGLSPVSVAAESFTLYSVPEPGTVTLACLGPIVMLAIRRKR